MAVEVGHRNYHQIVYLNSIGIDAERIIEGSINSEGYDTFTPRNGAEPKSRAYGFAGPVPTHVTWEDPNHYYHWYNQRELDRAAREDWDF